MAVSYHRRKFLTALACIAAGGLGWTIAQRWLGQSDDNNCSSGATGPNMAGLVPLIYTSGYNISAFGLEYLHPFDGRKFAKIERHLIQAGLRTVTDFIQPLELVREQLLKVHTPEYLDSLKDSRVLAKIFEVAVANLIPAAILDWRVLHPMRLAGGGTLMACRLALQNGLAINLGGGYHHADRNHGSGFCCYSDVPIALTLLREEGKIANILIIDTDAHQGNGFANVLRNTGCGHVIDLFDESIYPFPKVLEDISIPLPARTNGQKYLAVLEQHVPEAIAEFKPDLIIYNAGSDVLASDPLSSLLVSPDEMCQRDLFVVSQAKKHSIPLAMVLSGGYGPKSASAHAQSIEGILRKYDQPGT
jgi:histone deacetylase 11